MSTNRTWTNTWLIGYCSRVSIWWFRTRYDRAIMLTLITSRHLERPACKPWKGCFITRIPKIREGVISSLAEHRDIRSGDFEVVDSTKAPISCISCITPFLSFFKYILGTMNSLRNLISCLDNNLRSSRYLNWVIQSLCITKQKNSNPNFYSNPQWLNTNRAGNVTRCFWIRRVGPETMQMKRGDRVPVN